jgi:uncharacterized repeat protein (TIGR03803 family)
MNIKHFRNIVVSVCLGWLAFSLALAQPVITTQPANEFLSPGLTASFAVSETGVQPFTYQWLFDGTAMASATRSDLILADPQPAQWGYYSVIVSNASGAVTSQVAELKVFVAALHSLSGIQTESNGSVNLSFAGETTTSFALYYDLYPLAASSNLFDWVPLAMLQRTNAALDTLHFLDTNAPMFSQRFYRTPSNQLVTPDPQPTGPYPVGTFSMLLTNTNRSNAKFMTTFWYPAVAQAGVLPAKYVEPQVTSGSYGSYGSQIAAFFSHSLSNAPIATNLASYPVVLYDPSWGGQRRENADKTEELASWGYVVVGLDTSDTTISVFPPSVSFPNGEIVYGQTIENTIAGVTAAIEGRLLDLQFVLDELESLNASDPRLGSRLDLDKIGAFGWSMGGSTVAQLCLRDPRCKAGAGIDWFYIETDVRTKPLNVPWLYFRSDDGPDPDPNNPLPDGSPDDRLEVFKVQVTNAYWAKLVSTIHPSFSDFDLILDSASFESDFGAPLSGQLVPPARVTQIVRTYLLSFFNKFLQGEDDHLLDGPSPAYPEVMQFLSASSISVPPKYPTAALALGADGNFYGTTEYGGASGDGTLFQVTTNGTMTTLVSFNGANGSHPAAALALGSDGNFYGTTAYGGTNGNNGTVFQMTPAGALTTLVSFHGANGSYPVAGLALGSNGNFYGTTEHGGASGDGTVFEMTSAGALTTLISFSSGAHANPVAALAQDTNGDFYGTTDGGLSADGAVFQMTPSDGLTWLVSFGVGNGANPAGGLAQGSDGSFYGTTEYGGASGDGTVFQVTTNGTLTTLVSFNGANGSHPAAALALGSDGNFYGTTAGGGPIGDGTVFKMTPAGALKTMVSFNGTNGYGPVAGLALGADGNFYGTTEYGGTNGCGTVFQMTPAGALTTLVSFGSQANAP